MISVVEEIAELRLSLPLLITSDVDGISFFWLGKFFSNELLFATIPLFHSALETVTPVFSLFLVVWALAEC